MNVSKRFESRSQRDINKDSFIHEWPEIGLVLFNSPGDPKPQIRIVNERIVELDGKPEAEFDLIDQFIAHYAIDVSTAAESMAMDSLAIARLLADFSTPRKQIVRLFSGLTPAKIMQVVNHLNVVEMMMALQKMRARRTPSNQAHVTNRRENPALLAADAAEAVERGFSELETTVGVARYAPFNAMAILIGSQTGRGTALTQCAVEEALSLKLAWLGLTTYAETLSVYGTEAAFRDGDDTPWSKAFLAAAYASRGIKIRFTSGSGSEALMGHAEGKSMLYLETRCLLAIKGAGSQGVQNGSISCIALPESLPGGVRGVLAENLIAALLDLEIASGNDAMASHSQIRKASKLMLQFLPGTDFIFSGYSSMPREDNLFGGGNFDAEDLDDYNILQRDMQVDGGIRPVREGQVLEVRKRAARAIQAVFAELGLPPITVAEVEAAAVARSSADMPERDVVADLAAAEHFLESGRNGLDVIRALARQGFEDIAEKILQIQKLRISGDYLQTSAVVLAENPPLRGESVECAGGCLTGTNQDIPLHPLQRGNRRFSLNVASHDDMKHPSENRAGGGRGGLRVISALNDPNDYQGPGTGYRLDGERWQDLADIPQAQDPTRIGNRGTDQSESFLEEIGPAKAGSQRAEIVVAVGPAFGSALEVTLLGLPHAAVLQAITSGIEAEGLRARVIKIYSTSDCGFIGHAGAQLSGSGVSIGIQSKGTTVIHRKDLEPLNNLELFPQAPNLTLESYKVIGRNAAKYAKGEPVLPVPIAIDNMARLKYIVKTTLLHLCETQQVKVDRLPQEIRLRL
jgi:propanediol dehydratase large subunit